MSFDVAARLDAGRPAVSRTQTYVTACHTLGYQHPDLTAHGAQVLQWYAAEDGMDLDVLDADCARLRAAAGAAAEAVRLSWDGQAALRAAWIGESGTAAVDFVQRHNTTATAVADLLRAAAEGCAVLRDTLWRLVEDKAQAAVAIDDRRADTRSAWLAAAQTVLGAAVDRTAAVETVTGQITPYVDADVRTDWVGAMRTVTASVAGAYDDAVHRLSSTAPARFEVPGQLGPPAPGPPRAVIPPPAAAAPASALASPASAVPAAPVAAAPPQPLTTADVPLFQSLPQTPPSGVGAAAPPGIPSIPDVGGGLSGLAGRIADALGGVFTGRPGMSTDPPPADGPSPAVQPDDTEPADDPPQPVAADGADAEQPDAGQPDAGPPDAGQPDAGPPDAAPPPEEEQSGADVPPPEPSPAPPAQPAEPPDEPTPCEIAADELPQVGQ